MQDLNEVFIFSHVVKAGSFSKAAQNLGIPKSTVSRKVSGLESRLGVVLLQRTTRKLKLTDVGSEYFKACAKSIEELEEAEKLATLGQSEPQGMLRVTCPVEVGTTLLPHLIHEFLNRYEKIEVDLLVTDRVVDLVGEGVDVAIRAGQLSDSGLIARKIGTEEFQFFASPAYLKKWGTPHHPRDLAQHQCLAFSAETDDFVVVSSKGRAKVKLQGRVRADNMTMLRGLAMTGHGIVLLPAYTCRDEVKAGRLARVLPEWSSERMPFYAVYPDRRFVPPKLKVFLEFISSGFKDL